MTVPQSGCAHTNFLQIGAATGQVGDPSGRSTERSQASIQQVEDNAVSIAKGIQLFFERASAYAWSRLEHSDFPTLSLQSPNILSNLMWHDKFTMLDFLHEVGKHVRINAMLSRERYVVVSSPLTHLLTLLLERSGSVRVPARTILHRIHLSTASSL